MTKKTDGRKAIVIDYGKGFTTHKSFARKHGYPEAAADNDRDDKRVPLKDGDTVTLLISGSHEGSYYKFPLWIVETANGERHIIAENGLRIIENETEGGESMENVIEIDGVKYREVKRKAAVGELIKIVDAGCSFGKYHNDEIKKVIKLYGGYPEFVVTPDADGKNPTLYANHTEYVVLEPITDDADDIAASDVDLIVLQRELNGLKRQQAELTKQVDGLTDAFAKLAAKTVVPQVKTVIPPQVLRDDIVAQAKLDVAELERTSRVVCVPTLRGGKMSFYPRGNSNGNSPCDGVKFIVNRDKRTVVALIHWLDREETVWARGIAKAAPGDVFNSHIGRAIALRRALGMPVPTEYTNAPQPDGVRVGDVVIIVDNSDTNIGVSHHLNESKYYFVCQLDFSVEYPYNLAKLGDKRGIWSGRRAFVVVDDSDRYEGEVSA